MKGKKIIVAIAVLLALGAAGVLLHRKLSPPVKDAYFVLDPRTPPDLAAIRPAHFVMPDARGNYWQNFTNAAGKPTTYIAGRGVTVREMISFANGFSEPRVIFPPNMPEGQFDYLVTVPDKQKERLQAMIKEKWGYTAHAEKRDVDVLALKVKTPDATGLQASTNTAQRWQRGRLMHYNVSILVWPTENRLKQIVVNETGLTNFYDFNWNFGPRDRATIDKMLANLGLGLEPKTESVSVLVVEKTH